ncbi:MAG: CBS domain-containing protein [Chloroflexota bacterium]|nr:CBS domain-containing protein [Chloroflexota bacterium]
MKVILTHEQADMDALASQLGAWLLFPEALPILPRNINRNGRRYLKRFGKDLPHIEYEQMPRKPIDTVFLVDTQSLITLKGMRDDTRIVVYDHHPKREDLNPKWDLHLINFGANVSQMVTRIQDKNIPLSDIHATTLALGLYEDTGSFTYGSTTTEDLQAAAFCINQGANLDIVGEFLYPPLSEAQRMLYDRLMKHVQTFKIKNQTILAVKANAMDVQDEISSVAHKMRDVLNPDALLLLVSTTQGIRLVARSTSDKVDVSSIAEEMGGGGHKRAASALIRPDKDLNDAETETFLAKCFEKMVSNLHKHIKSAVTVASIMSKNPLILTPETSAQEAHRLMQRYGYEGYPVVSDENVVGLLNRREVDRALSHGLDLTVESLMAAGDVSIPPEASLETLQTLMGSSDWGQVPVVSQETGEIIGIVTRTDLLKTLTAQPELPSQEDISKKLSEAVPPARLSLLHAMAEEADKINIPIFVVGGFVRDLLLDRPSLDFDIVVEGDAIFFAKRLADRYGGRVLTHKRFGTAKWQISSIRKTLAGQLPQTEQTKADQLPKSLDLITARTEFYEQPAALPTVESSSIKMDLHRRDFTINTLALRLDGEHYGQIYDYWGGLSDLRKGHIRVLHALSFVDDATRLLRAVRFEQRFDFQIEQRTLDLMEESLPLLNKLTGARLQHEINLILAEPKAPAMLARLDSLKILKTIHPSLPWDDIIEKQLGLLEINQVDQAWNLPEHSDSLNLQQTLSYLVWLGQLPETTLRSIVSRLRFKSEIRKLLISTSQLNHSLDQLVNAPPSFVVHRLDKAPRTAIYAAYLINSEKNLRKPLWMYVSQWADVMPHTTGDDLREMGLPPSPAYGTILSALRVAWLDGGINSQAEEERLLSTLIADLD